MARRLNTIIFVPHSKAKFVKLSFSTRTLVLGGVGLAVALMLSLVAIVYTGSAVNRRAEVGRLTTENEQLREVNLELEDTVADVQARLDEFEERTRRLALAAGMESVGSVTEDRGGQERMGSGGPYDRVPEGPAALRSQGDQILRQLQLVEGELGSRNRNLASTPTIAPATGLLTDGFGTRRDPFTGRRAAHRGVDISARRGTPVVAPADGVVIFAGWKGGFGRTLHISHGFGYTTVFGHLDKLQVEPGDEVRRGQAIGLLGSSGRSTGPHLHYEVHVDGKAVNPLYYILDAF